MTVDEARPHVKKVKSLRSKDRSCIGGAGFGRAGTASCFFGAGGAAAFGLERLFDVWDSGTKGGGGEIRADKGVRAVGPSGAGGDCGGWFEEGTRVSTPLCESAGVCDDT